MSLSNAQRAILRDMADGAELKARSDLGDRHYLRDAQVNVTDVYTLHTRGLLRHLRCDTTTYTLTPAGAEAAREGMK